ncbi:MAG: hypothetical protein RLZZ111_2423, partial [Planctomycetota bacterium]
LRVLDCLALRRLGADAEAAVTRSRAA